MTKIPDFTPFLGQHCETMATGNLLHHAGLPLSEPMIFGLGQGIGFGIFTIKSMPAPFIGGRTKSEEITKTLATHLGLAVDWRQTRSRKKAWDNIAAFIDKGQPVAAKLDCYYLDYFSSDFHFGAHYVAVHGYSDTRLHVVDTIQQGSDLTTDRAAFEEGRLWKGPMASNAMTWTIEVPKSAPDWPTILRTAIRANARAYLTPPIRNFGASGIRKAASLAPDWGDTIKDAAPQLAQMGMLIERAGTGGGLFRRIYADFLAEAGGYVNVPQIAAATELIRSSAGGWTQISEDLARYGDDPAVLGKISATLTQIAAWEEEAFGLLAQV